MEYQNSLKCKIKNCNRLRLDILKVLFRVMSFILIPVVCVVDRDVMVVIDEVLALLVVSEVEVFVVVDSVE